MFSLRDGLCLTPARKMLGEKTLFHGNVGTFPSPRRILVTWNVEPFQAFPELTKLKVGFFPSFFDLGLGFMETEESQLFPFPTLLMLGSGSRNSQGIGEQTNPKLIFQGNVPFAKRTFSILVTGR